MNAPTRFDLPEETDWSTLVDRANAWRGSTLDCFARGELAAYDTLTALSNGKKVPVLTGKRYEALRHHLEKDPAYIRPLNALDAFLEDHPVRNLLCHGVMTVLADQRQRWHVSLRMPGTESRHFDELEAGRIRIRVQNNSQRLRDLLKRFTLA